jgi:hypothetical protein
MSQGKTASYPIVGKTADRKPASSRVSADVGRCVLVLQATALLGCRVISLGLPEDAMTGDSADRVPSGEVGDRAPIDKRNLPEIDSPVADPPVELTSVMVDPLIAGCSDGTREGFRKIDSQPRIAGCAGGWSIPGLLSSAARTAQCGHRSGNSYSVNPIGNGCSVADLCSPQWHPCNNGQDLLKHSPGGCEGILSPGERAFFLVMTGASNMGMCYPEPSPDSSADFILKNDLHGCGSNNIGLAESDQCSPLTRRMGFDECDKTKDMKEADEMGSVWNCGNSNQSLSEAEMVYKTGPSLGGVLCCKDD